MSTAIQPVVGTYDLDPVHSRVGFAVVHMGLTTFRSAFTDVDGRLVAQGDSMTLEARAGVGSLAIDDPPEFRDHVVHSPDFLQADTYPVVTFRSSRIELRDDGSAIVTGELALRGVTRTITAEGGYRGPIEDPVGATRLALELRTTIDRRTFGMSWQLALPDGNDALGWDVELTADLELVKTD
jgi:polyisoprenoid-binding protein YceI